MTARFDDLRPGRRRSFALGRRLGVLEALDASHVPEVLADAEQAVRAGHWVAGWVTYEAAPGFDPALVVHEPIPGLPAAWFSIHDGRGPVHHSVPGPYRLDGWLSSITEEDHAEGVTAIRQHIRNGNTYQVNHTFRLRADHAGDPLGLYLDLARSQNAGYGAFLDSGRWVVASASPELFFEWRHGRLTCRPMKGTAARGPDLASDETQRSRLEHSEKDRAENLMIVDMVRNDLGRIACTGTVAVPALFTTEKYDTVWQLTSTVTATARPGLGLVDVFAALFPSASITGAPKVATMRIIRELERDPRGVYCGAIGFGGPGADGQPEWAFNVAIRTVLMDQHTGVALYGTGGGITYDSTARGEYREAVLKAEVLARRSADFRLLETFRWDPEGSLPEEGFRRLDLHLERLADSARYFDVPFDPAEVRAALDRAVAGRTASQRVRLLVDRTGLVEVEATPLDPDPPVAHPPGLLHLALDTCPVDDSDPFLHHKTTNREVYDAASRRHPRADDVILVNRRGEVTETTIGNLVAECDGDWVTPPVSSGCLPGVERRALLESGTIRERVLTADDLRSARRLARVNSVRGWQEAVLLPQGEAER